MRDLPIEGKITIFKTLAISKIVCLGLVTSVPAIIIKQLNKKTSFGKGRKQNKTLYCAKYLRIRWQNTYELGGLKDTDIFYKIISLQYSWVRRLFDKNFH